MQLTCQDLEQCGGLWQITGISAMRHNEFVWLKGTHTDSAVQRQLASLSSSGRFEVLPDGALRRPGERVPLGYLPAGEWYPLAKFFSVTLPPIVVPARTQIKVAIRLTPSTEIADPNLLITNLTDWAKYSEDAPFARLRRLKFAVSRDRKVLVHGSPLPPLPGIRGVVESGLAVPCGWRWSPHIEATVLAQAWKIQDGEVWLMWPGQSVERVLADQWVAASHSAIRQTEEAFQNGSI